MVTGARISRQRGQWQDQSSAHGLLHERADPCLFGSGQLLQREGGRPHGAFVKVRLVAEAERRVSRFEFLRALEEADDLTVLGIRGHPVPGFRREGWRAGFDDRMEPLGHGAIRFHHLGDLREHVAFPVSPVRARAAPRFRLLLLGALLHRSSFLVRESLGFLVGRGGALGGLLRFLLWAHRNLDIPIVGSIAADGPDALAESSAVGLRRPPLPARQCRAAAHGLEGSPLCPRPIAWPSWWAITFLATLGAFNGGMSARRILTTRFDWLSNGPANEMNSELARKTVRSAGRPTRACGT